MSSLIRRIERSQPHMGILTNLLTGKKTYEMVPGRKPAFSGRGSKLGIPVNPKGRELVARLKREAGRRPVAEIKAGKAPRKRPSRSKASVAAREAAAK